MTELSDELLVAYVDGQLVREQTSAVDKVLEVHVRVRALVDLEWTRAPAHEGVPAALPTTRR